MDSQQYLAYHSSSIQNGQPQPVSSSSTAAWANAHSTSFVYGHPPHHVQPSGRVGELRYASTSQNASVDGGGQPDLYGTQPGATTTGTGAEFSQMTLGLDHQLDSSIGPSRGPQTRSKRIAQQQRSVSAPGLQNVLAPDGSYYGGSMSPPVAVSRPQTPNGSISRGTPMSAPPHPGGGQHSPSTLSTSSLSVSHSPTYPSTPISASTDFSRYSFRQHSRSASGATSGPSGARSASPALSVRSALTSVSSTSFAHERMSPSYSVVHDKQKKTRLTNAQRREICVWYQGNPTARQEDMAAMWQVERSTISKILKAKAKWLASPLEDENKSSRHKPSKFPEIEKEMETWLEEIHPNGKATQNISDQLIRTKAKTIARALNIGEDKFKASSGWVENFKHRHNIKRGVWCGNEARIDDTEKNSVADLSSGIGSQDTDAAMQDGTGIDSIDSVPVFELGDNPPPMYPPPLPSPWEKHMSTSQFSEASNQGSSSLRPELMVSTTGIAPAYVRPPTLHNTSSMSASPLSNGLPEHLRSQFGRQGLGQGQGRHVSMPVQMQMYNPSMDPDVLPTAASQGSNGQYSVDDGLQQQPTPINTSGAQSPSLPSPLDMHASYSDPNLFNFGHPAASHSHHHSTHALTTPTAANSMNAVFSAPAGPHPAPVPVQALETNANTIPDANTNTNTTDGARMDPTTGYMKHENSSPDELPNPDGEPHADGTMTPMPTLKEAERHMTAILDFFDSQPDGTIITEQDRENLAQIRCKLHASANGVSYAREHRDRRRQPSQPSSSTQAL